MKIIPSYFGIIDKDTANDIKEDHENKSNTAVNASLSTEPSLQLEPIQTKEVVLNFEAPQSFEVETLTTVVKHKKFGNKKARKVLKRINVISKLKKKSKKQSETSKQVVIDDKSVIPTVHVESLRSRRSSSISNQAESQNSNSELIDKVALSIIDGKIIF